MLEALMKDIASQGGLTRRQRAQLQRRAGDAAPVQVLSLRAGYNVIDLRDRSPQRARRCARDRRRDTHGGNAAVDPNYGEWMSVPPESAFTSFGVQPRFAGAGVRTGLGDDAVVIHFKLS
jgi:hypothetical protein